MSNRTYTIEPRLENLGGGFNLKFFEDGKEAGGGVFPLDEYMSEALLIKTADKTVEEIATLLAFEDAQDYAMEYCS